MFVGMRICKAFRASAGNGKGLCEHPKLTEKDSRLSLNSHLKLGEVLADLILRSSEVDVVALVSYCLKVLQLHSLACHNIVPNLGTSQCIWEDQRGLSILKKSLSQGISFLLVGSNYFISSGNSFQLLLL